MCILINKKVKISYFIFLYIVKYLSKYYEKFDTKLIYE